MSRHRAYVGIGSNLGDRAAALDRALAALSGLGKLRAISSLYRTQPWGIGDQPWFLNAVALLETEMPPLILLERMQEVERDMGRVRAERWGPREIDLDLLMYDDLESETPQLRLPHPHWRERAFVLVPLAEIDARFSPFRDALDASELAGVVRVERESVTAMPDGVRSTSERVRALAQFLTETDAVRVRIERADGAIEVSAAPKPATVASLSGDRRLGEVPSQRIDAIKADIVGIFHAGRPAPAEGDVFESDRELGYVEALGIRTPVHSMGAGRLVSVAAADGSAVEYGQPLFFVARGK
jgi:2-amino-4-hydroxy-6-hydroxymethyldihydropteridine diphosphokinase